MRVFALHITECPGGAAGMVKAIACIFGGIWLGAEYPLHQSTTDAPCTY